MSLLFHICLYLFLFMLALIVYCVGWVIGYHREMKKQLRDERRELSEFIAEWIKAIRFNKKTHNWKDEGF